MRFKNHRSNFSTSELEILRDGGGLLNMRELEMVQEMVQAPRKWDGAKFTPVKPKEFNETLVCNRRSGRVPRPYIRKAFRQEVKP